MSSGKVAHTVGMLAAGVVAGGLVLAAWALAPKAEPEPVLEAQAAIDPVGRWEFVDSSNDQAFVEFTEYGTWFGSDGCNGTGAAWSADGSTLKMSNDGVQTLIWCDNAVLPTGATLDGTLTESGDLTLANDTGATVTLTRTGDSTATLEGGSWVVPADHDATAGAGGDTAPAEPVGQPSISFADDGTWSGTDGCNRMRGSWTWERLGADDVAPGFGATLSIGDDTVSTKMACEHPSTFPMELTAGRLFALLGPDTLVLEDPAAAGLPSATTYLTRTATEAG